jgi:hypothetical protein
MTTRLIHGLLGAAALVAAPAAAQLLPGGVNGTVGSVGRGAIDLTRPLLGEARQSNGQRSIVGSSVDRLSGVASSVADAPGVLLNQRAIRLSNLIKQNRGELDRDNSGNPVRRDRLVAVDPDSAGLAAAARAGFRVIASGLDPQLGLGLVTFAVPTRVNPREALDTLRRAAPSLDLDYDHIYEPAGGALAPTTAALAMGFAGFSTPGARIAMIDGGVGAHPSMARASVEQKGFAGAAVATGHGTAVASLLVGDQGAFRGAARGANLFVGDIYGGNAAAGSASTIVSALAWAAAKRPSIITISLVGPPNRAIERTVAILRARGIKIVAAVGNDGPAAPPQYPASYDGVVAVTGVDAKGRALIEAGRARHLDFAAPGAELAAALPGRGYAVVRGTSFAAPLAAARLAATGSLDALAAEAQPGKGKVGRGIVCAPCRVEPRSVGAR